MRKSFEVVVGLNPFSESKMRSRIDEILPKYEEKQSLKKNDEISKVFQKQIEAVLSEHITKEERTKYKSKKAMVKTGEVYTTTELEILIKKKKEEKQKK